MPNNPYLMTEEQLPGNWAPIDAGLMEPGKAPQGAPAPPIPHDMPQYFSGSLAPQLQHDASFVSTEVGSPRIPKYSIMPLGFQASAFTNAATQSTASKTTVVPSTDIDFYQIMQSGGSPLIQRTALNFIGFLVADNPGNSSTDVTAHIQFTMPSIFASVADTNLPGPVVMTLATQNKNKFWGGPVSGADATPTFRLIDVDDLASNGVGTSVQALFSSGTTGTQAVWNTVWYQTIQKATTPMTQRASLNFTPTTIFNVTDNAGNNSTDVALFTDVANGVPLLDSNGYLKLAEQAYGVNAQSGTTYTVLDTDRWKLVSFSNGSPIAVTLPQAGASVQFLSGWSCLIVNEGVGGVTITPTTSTIDGGASLVLTTGQGVILISDGANYFTIRGIGTGSSGVTSLNSLIGALNITAGTGISVTPSGSNIQITNTGTSINFADAEVPSGSMPGTAFTLANSPSPAASLQLFWNGQLLIAGGVDYTLSGASITTVSTIGAGDTLIAWYRY